MTDKEINSIYKRYKRDTDSVASWLARTAKELGYPLDLSSTQPDRKLPQKTGGRLKGKARHEALNGGSATTAHGNTKYIIPLHDFTQLSNFIAQRRNQVTIPDSFFTTVDRLIDLRSGFGKLLIKSGKTLSSKDKAHHDYFVNILTGVRGLLCPNRKPKPTTAAVSPLHEREEDPSSSGKDVQNRFSALSIDEPSEAFLERFAAESQQAERPSQPTDDATIFEAEPQTRDEDLMLLCHGLLADLREVRNRIEVHWGFRNGIGSFDLVSAAVTTNIEISLCRGLIEEVEPLLERGEGGSFGVMERVATILCPTDNVYATGPKRLPATSPAAVDDASIRDGKLNDIRAGILHDRQQYFSHFMVPIKALKTVHERMIIHDGFFLSPRDSSVVHRVPANNALSADERFDRETLAIEHCSYDIMLALQTLDGYPIEDELFRAVRRYNDTGKLSISLVFSFQVYLDIKRYMEKDGSILSTFEKAKTEMQNCLSDLDAYVTYRKQGTDTSTANFKSHMAEVAATRGLITSFTDDRIFQEKERISRLTGYDPPETVRHRFLRDSPLMCGLYLFYCRTGLREIALRNDDSETFIACAHLYSALKKENLLEADWPDMDTVLSLIGDGAFWVGGKRPETYHDYWKALGLRLGISPSRFTDIYRPGAEKLLRSGAKPRPLTGNIRLVSCQFPIDTIRPFKPLRNMPEHAFAPVTNGDTFIWTPLELENMIQGRSSGAKHHQPSRKSTKTQNRDSEPPSVCVLSLLVSIKLQIESELIAFPILRFFHQCRSLLIALLQALKQILPQQEMLDLIESHEILPYAVSTLFHFSNLAGPKDGKLMGAAADVVDKWLPAGMGDACLVASRNAGLPIRQRDSSDTEE